MSRQFEVSDRAVMAATVGFSHLMTGFGNRRLAELVATRLDPGLPSDIAKRSPLAVAWRQLDKALEGFIADRMVAA